MPDYNFLNLSPPEFEDLSRDLLQEQLKCTLESFTTGRDNGIDLRYASSNNSTLIVQCKRYKDFTTVYSNLQKEIKKVKALLPSRYIICTSAGLTPNQKDKIITLFDPFILSTNDIYGKDDLNNLLGKFPKIEQQHFKLWLASTNILQRILNSKIYNQSNFEEQSIRDTINVYVQNDSYEHAKKIITEKKYVIISGIPGIGKTTLARILAYHYLANGFDEFIYLSDSVNEGYTIYKEGVKQIFMFDDFLGTNFLENKLNNNEDQRIVKFIEKISKSKDKIIILTTREYILAQAKQKYDKLNSPSLETAKCTIDLSKYTRLIRTKILYNHLFFSNLSEKHLLNLLKDKNYQKVIDHPNYNPRIIETITNEDVWHTIEPRNFATKFIEFIKNPKSVWQHVFDNQISPLAQCLLANMMTAGAPIFLNDLKLATQTFAKDHAIKYGINHSEIEFKKSIKELENTFIKIKQSTNNDLLVEYQNPSVQDFLVFHFRELPDFISDLISSATYINQLFKIFSHREDFDYKIENRILLNQEQLKFIISKIISDFDSLKYSAISNYVYPTRRKISSNYTKLQDICTYFQISDNTTIRKFIIERFEDIMYPGSFKLEDEEITSYVAIIEKLNQYMVLDIKKVLYHISESVIDIYNFKKIEELEKLFGEDYLNTMLSSQRHQLRIKTLLTLEVENIGMDDWESNLDEIIELAKKYKIDYTKFRKDVIARSKLIDNQYKEEFVRSNKQTNFAKLNDVDDNTIRDIFDSLRTEQHNNAD